MIQPPVVYIISGTPGAGKSSVAEALMKRFPKGLHIPMDDLREWVVSGRADPIPTWTSETTRQFALARKSAAHVARVYAEAGFAVAVDDVIFPYEAEALFEEPLVPLPVRKVLLRPNLEAALSRNATRTNKVFDTSVLEGIIRDLDRNLSVGLFHRKGWAVIDSSNHTLEETVDAILALG